MFVLSTVLIAIWALGISGQVFEPADFDVAEALLKHGVNASQIPVLSGLSYHSSKHGCPIACSSLELLYGANHVIVSSVPGYGQFTSGYWSLNQALVSPFCIFKPPSVEAVSISLLISRLTQCPFAAKSGGHAAFAGASNIEGGITISFENLNSIEVSPDRSIVFTQPGLTWGQVYSELAKSDLAVIGGRVAKIGVGGLTLGGGISFFSSIYGWACDNVASYDIVIASGAVITATPTQYADLYWALRGGGNNFGLVVKFGLNAISLPNNEMWGGTRVYIEDQFPAVVRAFSNVVANSPQDGNAGQWIAWLESNGTKIAATELWYANPSGTGAPIFAEYDAIHAISDSTQPQKLAEFTELIQESNPYGLREVYYGLTVKLNLELAYAAKDIFFEEIPLLANVTGVNPVLLYQGITVPQIQQMAKNGGNPLGFRLSDGPLYLIHIACWWENKTDDTTIYQVTSRILERIAAEAEAMGVQNDYIYMNYASQFENVIRSYGAQNQARLKSIAKKYDPTQVFQILQPGYFKLDRAPVPNSGYFGS